MYILVEKIADVKKKKELNATFPSSVGKLIDDNNNNKKGTATTTTLWLA